MFATGFLILAACLLAQVIVGDDVWNRSAWRRYFFPGFGFVMGLAMWGVALLASGSTIHLLAHFTWAQVMMLAGAAELGLVRGKLKSEWWKLCLPVAVAVSGAAFLIHEANPLLYSRSAFVHHMCGWILLVGALFPLGLAFKPRSWVFAGGYALVVVAVSVALYTSRDVAAVFGHLDPSAGVPHR